MREVPPFPFHTVHMDMMSGLPDSNGMNCVWVVTDRLTSFTFYVAATVEDDARTLARRLFDRVFSVVGLPTVVVSDADPRLSSSFTQSLAD